MTFPGQTPVVPGHMAFPSGVGVAPAGFSFVTTNNGQNYVTTNNGADRLVVRNP